MKKNGSAITQIELGNSVEHHVSDCFQKYGFWSHIFINGIGGQPCDIIALRNKVSVLIDCKHLKKGTRFDFSRIEDNQFNCFEKTMEFNKLRNIGFVIYSSELNCYFFLDFKLVKLALESHIKSINLSDCELFSTWINRLRNESNLTNENHD